jgi:hypothetical protein
MENLPFLIFPNERIQVFPTMIIGLIGKKGSGKDTVGAYLVKMYDFQRISNADKMKASIAALFDIPFEDVDKYKNDPEVFITLHRNVTLGERLGDIKLLNTSSIPIASFNMRDFQKRYGTEAHRDVLGEDIWVDAALPVGGYYAGRKIVVTDVRFPNEAQRIKDLGGYLVRIYRNEVDILEDNHESEAGIDRIIYDSCIYNSGAINDLYLSIEEMLADLDADDY